jgi:hypothetical protein
MRTELLRFNGAVERDPAIDAWMKEHAGELGAIAHQWFEVMRKCGDEVRELLHDGCPIACLGDAPFGYVNVFRSHVNVGLFHGAALTGLDQHDVIGPEFGDRRHIPRQRCRAILFAQFLDRGRIPRAGIGPVSVHESSFRPACG